MVVLHLGDVPHHQILCFLIGAIANSGIAVEQLCQIVYPGCYIQMQTPAGCSIVMTAAQGVKDTVPGQILSKKTGQPAQSAKA